MDESKLLAMRAEILEVMSCPTKVAKSDRIKAIRETVDALGLTPIFSAWMHDSLSVSSLEDLTDNGLNEAFGFIMATTEPRGDDDRCVFGSTARPRTGEPTTRAFWVTENGTLRSIDPREIPSAASPLDAALRQVQRGELSRGWIALVREPARLTVTLDFASIAPDAYAAAVEIIAAWRNQVWVVHRSGGAWVGESMDTGAIAAERLRECYEVRQIYLYKSVDLRPISWSSFSSDRVSPVLRKGLESWDSCDGVLSDAMVGSGDLLATMQVMAVTDTFDAFPFLFVGPRSPSATVFGHDWSRRAAFAKSLPDATFGRQATASFAAIAESWEPSADLVHARVRRPGYGDVWIAYERVILPMTLANGAPVLTSIAALVPFTLDLPGFAGSERSDPQGPSKPAPTLQ